MHGMTVFDVRSFEPRFRHALIFSMFEGLVGGESFVLLNDHDPVPLRRQFEALGLPNLEWQYLESGPRTWRVKIEKTDPQGKKSEGCCGICGGDE
ncbi:MAG: DUF2249 domain-containing protein [Bdellovibrionaceae bacterium]|nr:DUF2249 domain-containing protein [Pseudobdellovibrionaceae bacterium]